jgi:UDP-N-acetylmuramate dehydrogenase
MFASGSALPTLIVRVCQISGYLAAATRFGNPILDGSMHIRENIPLAPFTTFGIGGPARWFAEAAGEDDVAEAAGWSTERNIPLFVLGGGSNLLISDAGFNGLVLRIALGGIAGFDNGPVDSGPDDSGLDGNGRRERILQAGAGEDWNLCVQRSVEQNWAGLECLAGIPGTVGGTPVQNVGAYGQDVASTIDRVRAFDLRERSFVELSGAECGFAYRRSRFNCADRDRFIVTRVDYRLTAGGAPTLRYAGVERELEAAGVASPTLAETAEAVRRIRRSKGMLIVAGDPDCRSAGSFFKNPVISEDLFQKIAAGGAAPPRFPVGSGVDDKGWVKIPAAWLIEQAGFHKGYMLDAAGISTRHTLALVNRGHATAQEILALAQRIADAVEARFSIRLEREPVLLGFDS